MLPKKTELNVTPADGTVEEVDFRFKSDYVGQARLYTDDTGQAASIYDLAGLDEDRWMVIGMNLNAAGCREYASDLVFLHAVDLHAAQREGRKPLEANEDGEVPVVSILCHDLTVQDIFDNVVDAQVSFRLNSISDKDLKLAGLADRPNQE